jgi:hypothetical protein
METVAVLAGLIAGAYAACDNACSGHGTCNLKDVCTCWQDWRMGDEMGGDCSDRQCPFELAWVDFPDNSGRYHKYLECAGRGICDRTVGECQCFDGYTGKGCQRTTCPNDCSGHGTCEYIEDLPFGVVFGQYYDGTTNALKGTGDYPVAFDPMYGELWDRKKTRGCLCDPLWTDVDCSRRMCPKGTDVLHERLNTAVTGKNQIQTIHLKTQENWNQTFVRNISNFDHMSFALKFKSTLNETYVTKPIRIPFPGEITNNLDEMIEEALESLPHHVVDDVTVSVYFATDADEWQDDLTPFTSDQGLPANLSIALTFTGDYVQGPQNLVSVVDYSCGDGCTPKITGLDLRSFYSLSYVYETQLSDYNNYECGRRGKCDYDSGLCQCFDGYTGEACGTQTALI